MRELSFFEQHNSSNVLCSHTVIYIKSCNFRFDQFHRLISYISVTTLHRMISKNVAVVVLLKKG